MSKKLNYNVPDGYFENLRTRLSAIPAQESRPGAFSRFAPYLALAACFAVAVIAGNAVLNRTAVPAASDEGRQSGGRNQDELDDHEDRD